MIWIFNLEKASACASDSYNELFQHLLKIEQLKLEDEKSGESTIAADVGLAFKKQWCLDYCKTNNYVVMESFSQENSQQNQEIQGFSVYSERDSSYSVAQGNA